MYKLILVDFPFTEKEGVKIRPALLLTGGSYGKHKIVLIAYVTSRRAEGVPSEIKVGKSSQNGLERDSVIKLHKIVNVPESAIRGELGELTNKQSNEVRIRLRKLFGL